VEEMSALDERTVDRDTIVTGRQVILRFASPGLWKEGWVFISKDLSCSSRWRG
jgi:hypothetical protein